MCYRLPLWVWILREFCRGRESFACFFICFETESKLAWNSLPSPGWFWTCSDPPYISLPNALILGTRHYSRKLRVIFHFCCFILVWAFCQDKEVLPQLLVCCLCLMWKGTEFCFLKNEIYGGTEEDEMEAGLELIMQLTMALSSWISCLRFPSAEVTSMCHHVWLYCDILLRDFRNE